MADRIRVGTCSWADEALSKYFYPPGLKAGERLAWYAEHFDTVELDSTYYRLPVESMAERWVEQTPDEFVMHVKAFGVMTRHPVKKEQLPTDLRDEAPLDEKGRVDRPSREFRGEVFRRFCEALEPLRAAGKLGGILFQFPSYVVYKDRSLDYLAWAREQMGDDVERAWHDRRRAVRLPLLRGRAARVGRAAARARRAGAERVRRLQQQQSKRRERRLRLAGRDERADAEAAPARGARPCLTRCLHGSSPRCASSTGRCLRRRSAGRSAAGSSAAKSTSSRCSAT